MFSIKKIERANCYSCKKVIDYGVPIKEVYIFCGPECLSKKFTVHQLINMYKR